MSQALNGGKLEGVPHPMEWDRWDESYQEAFLWTVTRAVGLIEEAEGMRWQTLAANAYLEFGRALGNEYPIDFGALPLIDRLAWEVLIRHLCNLLGGYDPNEDGDLSEHEAHWSIWVSDRLGLSTLFQQPKEELSEQGELDVQK